MISDSSRYRGVTRSEGVASGGRPTTALRLRRAPATDGEEVTVRQNDRLDLMANDRYGEATRFWRIADANSELDARALVAEPGRVIRVPES